MLVVVDKITMLLLISYRFSTTNTTFSLRGRLGVSFIHLFIFVGTIE